MKNSDKKLPSISDKSVQDIKDVLQRKVEIIGKAGELRGVNLVKRYATVVEILVFKSIKESGEFKGLPYSDGSGTTQFTTSIKDFCKPFLHRSYESLQQDLLNLEAFGQEFLESSQEMGLGYREMRKLRQATPEEQKQIIESEAFKNGDVDALKDQIEDITEQHAKEKEALEAKALEAERTANARQKIINTNNSMYEEASQKYDDLKASMAHKPTSWIKTVREINIASSGLATKAVEIVNQLHDLGDRIVQEETDSEHSEQALEMMAKVHVYVIDQLFMAVNGLSIEARDRFAGYVDTARVMYSEAEIEALEAEIEARG